MIDYEITDGIEATVDPLHIFRNFRFFVLNDNFLVLVSEGQLASFSDLLPTDLATLLCDFLRQPSPNLVYRPQITTLALLHRQRKRSAGCATRKQLRAATQAYAQTAANRTTHRSIAVMVIGSTTLALN